MADKELMKRAKDAGLEVDNRWSDETLRRKVAQAEAEGDTDVDVTAITADAQAKMDGAKNGEKRAEAAKQAVRAAAEESPLADADFTEPTGEAGMADEKLQSNTVQQVQVELVRDYWDDEGKRHRVGKRVHLPVAIALKAVSAGTARPVED